MRKRAAPLLFAVGCAGLGYGIVAGAVWIGAGAVIPLLLGTAWGD